MGELVERVDEHDRVLGVVDRDKAIRARWLHRVATVVCRDGEGRIFGHRRPEGSARFPGYYNWLIGGAVAVGESYEEAAGRELTEELRVGGRTRFILKFLCQGAIAPYWLGLHEAVIDRDVVPDPTEIGWYGWLSEADLREAMRQRPFVPDSVEAFGKYAAGRQHVDTSIAVGQRWFPAGG